MFKIKKLKLKDIANRSRGINKIIKKLSNKHWFELMLDDYLEKRDSDRERIRKERFSPSIAANCQRYIQFVMDAIAEETNRSGKTIRKLDVGNDMHNRYKKYFLNMGILVGSEVEIKLSDPPIHGYIDSIIKSGGKEWLIELKSRADTVDNVTWNDFKMPSLEHEVQWQLYAKFNGPKEGFLLYENKNDQSIKIFDRELDEAFLQPYLSSWASIEIARSEGKIIDIPIGGCPNSKWCGYKKRCLSVEMENTYV